MRIAVCNRYWDTAGGGESYALGLAAGLARLGEVDLLGPAGVEWDRLFERLRVRPDAAVRQVDVVDSAAVAAASRDYDLFVNVSWAGSYVSLARRSVLVVHFPFRILEREARPWQRRAVAALAGSGLAARDGTVTYGRGFHPPEGGASPYRWTDGDGELLVWAPPGRSTHVEVVFGGGRPCPANVCLLVDGSQVAAVEVGPATGGGGVAAGFEVTGKPDGLPYRVRVVSDAFNPAQVFGSDDDRRVGVPVREVRVAGSRGGRLLAHARWRSLDAARRAAWLRSYDRVIANSAFTARWIRRWWGRGADVLHPPVVPRPRFPKDRVILSVGRFFPPERGHSKRQLRMVEELGRLTRAGLQGWELHLAGTCQAEDRPYLRAVKEAARGLPVRIHLDATGKLLDELYGRASVYWHAAGIGERPDVDPERLEHFGIAVVEAMSAGAVPIVAAAGGPAESVRHGIDGYHAHSLHELGDHTLALAGDAALRERLSAAAAQRALGFSPDAFARRLVEVVEPLLSR